MRGKIVDPVNLLAAFLYRDEEVFEGAFSRLRDLWGGADHVGEPLPFDVTDYYREEMGENLVRRLVSFARLIDPSHLPDVKVRATEVEDEFREGGKRRVNIDVGYVDFHKVVLASWKGRGNKVYLRDGVWADLTLFFHKGKVLPFEWSFPDFRAGTYDGDLLKIRNLYREKIRRVKSGG